MRRKIQINLAQTATLSLAAMDKSNELTAAQNCAAHA